MKACPTVLQITDLVVERGRSFLLRIPSLVIGQGEILSLIGPNGCGKTTLLMALAGLLRPHSGEIIFKGEALHRSITPLRYRRNIAMVFQESLLLNTTVWDNVAMGLRFRGMAKRTLAQKVMENLERFRITHLAGRPARSLSGGEAQRTSLARAFAVEPDVLFLDEPFSSLDAPSRESLLEDLEVALRRTRTTAVFATHDRIEALRLSDRMAVMNRGRILQIGPPGHVTDHPADGFVAFFVGVENLSPGTVVARNEDRLTLSMDGHEIEALGDFPVGSDVTVCLRPEKVLLSPSDPAEGSDHPNHRRVRIERIVLMGAYAKVYLDGRFPRVAIVSHRDMEDQRLGIGQVVWASFSAHSVHLHPLTDGHGSGSLRQ